MEKMQLNQEAARRAGTSGGGSIIERLMTACKEDSGVLMLINLDNFELFNDIYGRTIGDKMLEHTQDAINQYTHPDDIKGRLGGDEFVVFCKGIHDTDTYSEIASNIGGQIEKYSADLIGEDMKIQMRASIGAVFVPNQGRDYVDLFNKADMALSYVKQSGNHGCAFYNDENDMVDRLATLSKDMEESSMNGALWLEYDYFSILYRYLRRYIQTYKGVASKVLITLNFTDGIYEEEEIERITKRFGELINRTLRKSDIMMQSRRTQFFILLPEMSENYLERLYGRIESSWAKTEYYDVTQISYEAETLTAQEEN